MGYVPPPLSDEMLVSLVVSVASMPKPILGVDVYDGYVKQNILEPPTKKNSLTTLPSATVPLNIEHGATIMLPERRQQPAVQL